jgi:dipeptidyl aminopeptidase/acylaminoacyl peptidase
MAAVVAMTGAAPPLSDGTGRGFESRDLYRLASVGSVDLSPDGRLIAYSVQTATEPGRPASQVWIRDLGSERTVALGGEGSSASGARWSPDGQWVAYVGRAGKERGLAVARPDGSAGRFLAPVDGTNHPLPSTGDTLAWSPDGRRIAFVSATPGPEGDVAAADPMVITRYLYKPTASEGLTRFNDNRRLHIFVADVTTGAISQLTRGDYYEHSIDWSPDGSEIAFISNREPDPDRVFNNDIFAVTVADGIVRRITDTRNAEYQPKWSPDGRSIAYLGTTRPLTSSETTMEDTHAWVVGRAGGGRREVGGAIDNRQGSLEWWPGGQSVAVTVQERGSVHLYRIPLAGGRVERLVGEGSVGAWSAAADGTLAYALATPGAPAELYLERAGEPRTALTGVNRELVASRRVAPVEAFRFRTFDGKEVEAFLTRPLGQTPATTHPLIVVIHGGPHGQQGPSFNHKAQVYAAQGWGVLMVNYRGSTGYGQAFADAIFGDQNGGEATDVLAGLDAALATYPWIDPSRLGIEGGSYGGQLTNWIITRTTRFKAAIPIASIANLVSFNYMAYYHDYLPAEFGRYPHERGLMDTLWERSALRYVDRVRTPTLLVHGENDDDVPIAEAEQFYIALKDVGVETVMVRYPREGHGIRETAHVVDLIDRSVAWYRRHVEGGPSSAGRR